MAGIDAVKLRQITDIFTGLVSELIVMAHDAESVRTVWREVLSDGKHNDLRSRDGYLYATRSMATKITMAIAEREVQDREDIAVPNMEMIIADGKSRRRIDFPLDDIAPELATDEAFQARDLVYIVGVNEISENNERLLEANLDTLKRQTYRVLEKIARKYEDEIKLVRITGPKISGIEAYIYHGEILRFVAYYKEEQALHKMLYPPHGRTPHETAECIVVAWNAMKRNIANDENFMDAAGRHLNKLGFLDNELVYTESGLKHRRFANHTAPETSNRNQSQEYGPEM